MTSTNLKSLRKSVVLVTLVAAVCLLMILTSERVAAIAGDLDVTFGTGGKVTTHITNGDDIGYAVALQTDGRIVVAGQAGGVDFAVARYYANGSIDHSFDNDGIAITDIVGQPESGRAVAIQNNGKIIVVGPTATGTSSDFAVVRYNTDGSLDTSFDTDGKVTTDIAGSTDSARGVAIQADGKIIVIGHSLGPLTGFDFVIVRYESNGALDTTFGSGGKLIVDIDNNRDLPNAVAIQGDGKIVVVGESFFDPINYFAVVRCNANGSLDTGFGNSGKVLTSISKSFGTPLFDYALAVAVQDDGKIVVGGISGISPALFAVVRYSTNGSLDNTFGSGGIVTTQFGTGASAAARSLVLQDNGKIVLAGNTPTNSVGSDFALARYNEDGSLDASFGVGGKSVTPIGSLADTAYGATLQSDGRIVVVGSSEVSGVGNEFAVARYYVSPLYPASRRFDFDGDGKSDFGIYRPSTSFWYVLNSGTNTITSVQYSLPTYKLIPADYTGDGRTDMARFLDGLWNVYNGGIPVVFGQAGDIPLPGDYDGDGFADEAVFRQGVWYVRQSRDGAIGFGFGISTDRPVPEDYDGDGKFDAAVYRDGVWYMRNSTSGFMAVQFGLSTDRPVAADYDGDSKADVAVYRDGTWYILGSSSGFRVVQFGLSTDIPVPADYDGDAKADIAVYRNGVWYLLRSSDSGFAFINFGLANDVPLESVYLP